MMDIRHLRLAYGDRILAQDINFSLHGGECLLLAGANGCGKSTLLKTLAASENNCLLIPTGIPKVQGFTVQEFIHTGCYKESNWAGKLQEGLQLRMEAALQLLGLGQLRGRDISTLSDGEFQKACIAVGLTRNADILLLDEPTAYLDVDNRLMVLQTLREVARKAGVGIIFSSHDIQDALLYAHRVLAFTPGGGFLESTTENRPDILQAAFPRLHL